MSGLNLRRGFWAVPVAGVTLIAITNCGMMPKVPGAPGTCSLDLSGGVDAIENFDFASQLKLDAAVAGKLKAGTVAAVEIKAVADKIDADLVVGCGGLAKDLDASPDGKFANGQDACNAAIKAIGDIKGKFGANAKVSLVIEPPQCGVDIGLKADCAAKCDATVTGGAASFKCEPGKLQGTCTAKCTGSCELTAAAACSGTCSGSCDATFSGTCSGKCDGKCDGKATAAGGSASCGGKCEGKCDAGASGSCGGNCGGSCKLDAGASCSGTCTGSCDVEMQAPKCVGKVTPPTMTADCSAKCDAKASANVSCTPAHVSVAITGAADAAAAAKFQAAITANFPKILEVAIGMKDMAVELAGEAKTVGDAMVSVTSSVSGQGAGGAMIAANVTGCVGKVFGGVADAAGSITANVSVSANVSASAKGSASGS